MPPTLGPCIWTNVYMIMSMQLQCCSCVGLCTLTIGGRMQVCTSFCACVDCHVAPSDLTQPWTLPPLRSIRIIYPLPSLPSRLMHRGVKHLVMLNHSRAQHARNHPEWQHGTREAANWGKKCHIALRERKRGSGGGRARQVKDLRAYGGWGKGGMYRRGTSGV